MYLVRSCSNNKEKELPTIHPTGYCRTQAMLPEAGPPVPLQPFVQRRLSRCFVSTKAGWSRNTGFGRVCFLMIFVIVYVDGLTSKDLIYSEVASLPCFVEGDCKVGWTSNTSHVANVLAGRPANTPHESGKPSKKQGSANHPEHPRKASKKVEPKPNQKPY